MDIGQSEQGRNGYHYGLAAVILVEWFCRIEFRWANLPPRAASPVQERG